MKFKTSKLPFLLFILFSSTSIQALTIGEQITQAQNSITANRQDWFNNLQDNIITKAPEKGSQTAEWDREVSNQYQAITGDRLALANADKNQDASYLYYTFTDNLLGTTISRSLDLRQDYYFYYMESLYKQATYAWDDKKNKSRSIDFILKDRFKRGRPYQVLDANGNYLNNYENITGSSFPSGHTWNGFRQAVTLAILFPEKGGEIFARAIEYGESRVIVGAHFGTDTIASRVGNYHTMAQILADDELAGTFVDLAKETRAEIAYECNMDVRSCLEQNSQPLVLDPNSNAGYYNKKELVEAPIITPEEIPDLAGNLLRLRFPYLDNEQWNTILASTAYPSNSLAGWNIVDGDPDSYWGLINLPDAYKGPSYFYQDFKVNQQSGNRYDISGFSVWDKWENDIAGEGRLIKEGDGTLVLSGHNTFSGLDVNDGHLVISGQSELATNSTVNDNGTLMISGNFLSDVDVNGGTLDMVDGRAGAQVSVNQKGKLIGEGTVGTLVMNEGGILAPGHSIGKITVENEVTFNSGSQYLVEISGSTSDSDTIHAVGDVTINGGQVIVSLENSENILSKAEVESLLGQRYNILSTDGSLKGQFDTIIPDYLFVGATVDYQNQHIDLNVNRNNRSFASVGRTFNEQEVARALDSLPNGNALYETVLTMDQESQAHEAFNALSGQIHADMMSSQMDASRHFREAMVRRLATFDTQDHLWVTVAGNWDDVSSDDNAHKYKTKHYGFYLGADTELANSGFRLGLAGGYTHSSLTADRSDGKSDNYHLALYGSKAISDFEVKLGLAHSWHRLDTTRNIAFGNQYDTAKSKYNATTKQIFTELSYKNSIDHYEFEPFVNLAYVYYENEDFNEEGGAAALMGDKQHLGTFLSVLGVRASTSIYSGDDVSAHLSGELGWQHQYSGTEREIELRFANGGVPFSSRSVSASKDSLNLKINMDFMLSKSSQFSIGYDGSFAKRHKNNAITADFTYHF